MKFLQHFLTVTLLLMASMAGGFDMNGISPEVIRPEADDLLPKNYTFRVLNDMSVRRTWETDDNRQLILDFEPKKDLLLCILLNYRTPVPMEDATKDFLILTQKEKAKWAKLPRHVAKQIGVHEDSRAMKLGKGYAVMETTGSGKCYAISVYPRLPKENRRALTDIGSIQYGAKSLTRNTSEKAVATIVEDEEKRQLTPGKADLAKSVAAAKAAAAARRAAAEEEAAEETPEVDTEEVVDTAEPEIVVADVEKKKPTKKKQKKVSAWKNLLAKIGIENEETLYYICGGIVLVVVFIFIFAPGGSKKKKAPTSAMSTDMLDGGARRRNRKF